MQAWRRSVCQALYEDINVRSVIVVYFIANPDDGSVVDAGQNDSLPPATNFAVFRHASRLRKLRAPFTGGDVDVIEHDPNWRLYVRIGFLGHEMEEVLLALVEDLLCDLSTRPGGCWGSIRVAGQGVPGDYGDGDSALGVNGEFKVPFALPLPSRMPVPKAANDFLPAEKPRRDDRVVQRALIAVSNAEPNCGFQRRGIEASQASQTLLDVDGVYPDDRGFVRVGWVSIERGWVNQGRSPLLSYFRLCCIVRCV